MSEAGPKIKVYIVGLSIRTMTKECRLQIIGKNNQFQSSIIEEP
jgi:hypothetical protein